MAPEREGLPVPPRRTGLESALARAGSVALWLVTAAVLGVLAACVIVPRFAGATPYTVLTGSMSPAIEAGSVVVVRPRPCEEIGVGDVITYQIRSDDPATITHRVHGVQWSQAYGRTLVTKGDANPVADRAPVREVQVRGSVWYAVPWVGRVARYGDPEVRILVVRAAGWGLIGYAGLLGLVALIRLVRRLRTEETSPTDVEVPLMPAAEELMPGPDDRQEVAAR